MRQGLRAFIAGVGCVIGGLVSAPAEAQPFTEADARQMLFGDGYEVRFVTNSGLRDQQLALFKELVSGRNSRSQFGQVAAYYGVIAISPSVFEGGAEAILLDPKSVPFRYESGLHSLEDARRVAMAGCNALVREGAKPCVMAAQIVPSGFTPRALSMSVFATEDFPKYRRSSSPKAFAVSASTRAYALAQGNNASTQALDACNKAASAQGARDCKLVLAD
jgi:hypothetical protein